MKGLNAVARAMLLAAGFMVASVVPASASFMGFYDVSNWTTTISPAGSDASVDTSGAPASIQLTSGDNGVGIPSFADFTIAAPTGGTVSFAWDYTTLDEDGSSFDPFGYLLNGAFTQLTTDGLYGSQSGFVSFMVSAGDVFGFRQVATDSIFGPGITTVSEFSAPVPEPTSLALLGLGLLGVARRLKERGA